MTEDIVVARARNRFDRMEFAGAFGDLGTLIPFVVAYLGVLKDGPVRRLVGLWRVHDRLWSRLPHADAGAAYEGHRRDRHDAGRANAGPHARDGLGRKPRHGRSVV